MSRLRAPGAAQEQARRVMDHLLGSGGLRTVAVAVTLLVGLGWFTDSLFEWLADLDAFIGGDEVHDWWPLHRVFGVLFFAGSLSVLWILAHGARNRYRPRVGIDQDPAKVRGLVLYLSVLRKTGGADPCEELEAALPKLTGLDDFRRRFGRLAWRMPIEAIGHHIPRLQQVVVISSRGVGGSRAQYRLFAALCNRLFDQSGLRVLDLAETDSTYEGGLDFDDVDHLSTATDDAYLYLQRQGLPATEILIDVTGGQKTNSIAGAAVALAEGRHIQYVGFDPSAGTYSVRVYDITYDV